MGFFLSQDVLLSAVSVSLVGFSLCTMDVAVA